MGIRIGTPEGTRDRLFSECAVCRQVERAAESVFRRQGYAELTTPSVEYYDAINAAGSPLPQESMLKVIDRSGKILVMRPDSTVAVGRVAAGRFPTLPLPVRLYYRQPVFRSRGENTGAKTEIDQCGAELIGASGLRADVEILSLALDVLGSIGLREYSLEIGHAGFLSALLDAEGILGSQRDALRTAVENKEFPRYRRILEEASNTSEILRRLPRLYGGPEILAEAKELCQGSAAEKILDRLTALWNTLEAAGLGGHVRFDLSLALPIEYYTGMIFRGWSSGAAGNILSGGRYDALISGFGENMPAAGFALDVEAAAECLEFPEHKVPATLVWYDTASLRAARETVASLPEGTAILSAADSEEEAAEEARRLGAGSLIVCTQNGRREVRV